MQDSGLLEVIQSIYPGSTKTSHILDGGYFDDSLKLFNRLIIFTQGDMTVGPALEYELTPIPLSLFDTATQIRRWTNKASKAGFTKTSLKKLVDPLNLTIQPWCTLVVDGWLLYMVKWEQNQAWQEIAYHYLSYVQYMGRRSQNIIVVFDGYRSPKIMTTFYLAHQTFLMWPPNQTRSNQLNPESKLKFLENTYNKKELIHLFSIYQEHHIAMEQRDNNAGVCEMHWLLLHNGLLK